jgi:YihY family inner membrane protein
MSRAASEVLQHPGRFLGWCLRCFRKNQGLLLAGALAYYALLSLVPLLILCVIALSHLVDPRELLDTLSRYLAWLLPGQSQPVLAELDAFLRNRDAVSVFLVLTMLFFSSLAFTVLENAMSVIFLHRVAIRRRHFLVSALLPYACILALGLGLLLITLVAGALQTLGSDSVRLLGHDFSLDRLSAVLLYLLGFGGEVLVLSAIYMVMPVGRLSWRHALIGGITAAVCWEISRHVLVWYFATLSKVNVVYGSLATAIVVLLSLEIGATVLLFGAQVISCYEQLLREGPAAARGWRTEG